MKFSTRILISFLAIVIIPVIMITVAYNLIINYRGDKYGVSEEDIYNNALQISRTTDDYFEELTEIAKNDVTRFEERAYLEKMNSLLLETNSFLVLEFNDRVVFNGSEKISKEKLEEILPEYGEKFTGANEWMTIKYDEQLLIKQVDFTSQKGSRGSAFIVSYMEGMSQALRQWLTELIFVGLLILVITVLVISLWLYWGVSKPLAQLKNATKKIRDGNLDFSVEEYRSVKEINELFSDFEDMRKHLKESQEEKMTFDSENKELIRNISHDLKTPITALKGYCEGIMDGVADTPEKMERYIRTIYNKANEMDRLINELTFYSKIDTNRMPYTFTKIEVNEYFYDCADELELELERERVQFMYKNELTEDTLVIADAEQLKRVIHNIINNSVKYMDKPERRIELRVLDAGDFVQIEIEDNGKGIAKKDQARIFDRFYRTDASRNSTRGGSGIGLSIVRKVIEDHGGKVWAGGEEGVGTTISFVLRKYQEVSYNE